MKRINKCCDRCHAPLDPQDRYCRNCGRRIKQPASIDVIAAAADRMCTDYCKWPDYWDEETEGTPLNESDHCRKCPLTLLLTGGNAGEFADAPTLMYGA